MEKIPQKILYLIIPILFVIIFAIDSLFFFSGVTFTSLINLKEFLVILLTVAWVVVLRRVVKLQSLSLKQKLGRFALLLTANYVAFAILNLLIQPEYTTTFPHQYQSFGAIIQANVITILVWITIIPALLIIRDLVFSKQKRTTRLYFNLFVVFTVLTSISVFITKQPFFKFSSETLFNEILVFCSLAMIVLLSFRNDWITYLPRKDKVLYFTVGIIVFVEIVALPDYVYKPTFSAYSLILYSFTNIISLMLLIYGSFAMLKLLFHLPTAKAFDRKLREVNSLYDLSRTLNSELNFKRLTQLITQLTSRVLESNSTWLQLYDPEENKLKIVSHINLSQSQILNNLFESLDGINKDLIEKRHAILINDVTQDKRFRDFRGWKKDARSFIAAPLFSNRQQLMGIIYAAKIQPYGFDIEDVSLLEGFANQAAIALENVNLLEVSIKKERLEQELRIARDVQLKLLPQSAPGFQGFELESYFITAYEVGGDYFDFIEFGDGRPGLVIGDVSGKGTSAAFYMAEFKGVIQTLAKTFPDPKTLACRANQIFYGHSERRLFVSAIVGKYIPEKHIFEFVRAGHNPVLYSTNPHNKPVFLQPPGLAIGLDGGKKFDTIIKLERIQTNSGDILIFFTDGLPESRNEKGEEFGEERLCQVLQKCRDGNASEIKECILDEVMDFLGDTPLHDDLTFIVMKVK